MVGILTIHGGRRLYGSVPISGAKNAVLPLLAATVVQSGSFCLEHCPNLTDVDATVDILHHLGCRVHRDGDTIAVDSRAIDCVQIPRMLMLRLRSSVIFLGALLARCRQARLWLPGGCCIGARPIDLHLNALRELGVQVEEQGEEICCKAARLYGGTVVLPFPSVGATENILLVGMGAEDPVTIVNAAREPEVAALAQFLRTMGAEVTGEGSATICLVPPKARRDCTFRVLPDRIEAATYLCALAACGGEISLVGVESSHILPILEALQEAGVQLQVMPDRIVAQCGGLHAIKPVRTGPYPAFPTDAQAPLMAALLCAKGTTYVEETIFEHRFRHVAALRAMGADIEITGTMARIRGVTSLHGADVASTDLRGGAAMVIAALGAEGVSHISETKHIFRGYDSLCEKLSVLGASIFLDEEPMEDTT